uniref:LYR motif containing 4 n=1 Tax=Sus scrofa TaxID=9823 RepID=A0A8D1UFC5_PIG
MAASSRAQVLDLYRAMLRESKHFSAYNYRTYAIRRIRDAFRENKNVGDPAEIQALVTKAKRNLGIIRRQEGFRAKSGKSEVMGSSQSKKVENQELNQPWISSQTRQAGLSLLSKFIRADEGKEETMATFLEAEARPRYQGAPGDHPHPLGAGPPPPMESRNSPAVFKNSVLIENLEYTTAHRSGDNDH